MDFAARSAWSRGAHLPEVVLLAPAADVGRIDICLLTPKPLGLGVRFQSFLLVAGEDRHEQPIFGQSPDLGQEFPCPFDGLGLEVIAK